MKYSCIFGTFALCVILAGCAGEYRMMIKRTAPTKPVIHQVSGLSRVPSKVLLLTSDETKRAEPQVQQQPQYQPDYYGQAAQQGGFNLFQFLGMARRAPALPEANALLDKDSAANNALVSAVEHALMAKGFLLVDKGVVSRIEQYLGANTHNTRENWNTLEKALLLGKETGADAIVQVRTMKVFRETKVYALRNGENVFNPVPDKYGYNLMWSGQGSILPREWWSVMVEIRMINIQGELIWAGFKEVKLTDVLPEDWKAILIPQLGGYAMVSEANLPYETYANDEALIRNKLTDALFEMLNVIPSPTN